MLARHRGGGQRLDGGGDVSVRLRRLCVKAWRNRRIVSALFDCPGAHHNPQRNPMPSITIPAEGAVLRAPNGGDRGGVDAVLIPSIPSLGVRGARWRSVEFVPGGVPPVPPFWARWLPDRTRYEPADSLADTLASYAARVHNFVYVGQRGRGGVLLLPPQLRRRRDVARVLRPVPRGICVRLAGRRPNAQLLGRGR